MITMPLWADLFVINDGLTRQPHRRYRELGIRTPTSRPLQLRSDRSPGLFLARRHAGGRHLDLNDDGVLWQILATVLVKA